MENEVMETMQMENAQVEDMAVANYDNDIIDQPSEKSGLGIGTGLLIGAGVTALGLLAVKVGKKLKAKNDKTEKKPGKFKQFFKKDADEVVADGEVISESGDEEAVEVVDE